MVTQSREEWLRAKTQAVSSTESAALFGLSPYLTAYELGVLKQGASAEDHAKGERALWGSRLQDAVAQGIADDYRVVISGCEHEFIVHPDHPKMGTSLDYRVIESSGTETDLCKLVSAHGTGILEIKNVDALEYKKWPENECPDHIEIQVQHQLEVTGYAWAVIGVLIGGNRTALYTRMRDKEVGEKLVKRVDEFWANLARGVLPPPVMPQDAALIIAMNQYAEPGKVLDLQEDVPFEQLLTEYSNCGEVERQVKKARDSMKAQILKRIGDAERVLVNGFTLTAAMVAASEVQAYTRGAYRNLRVTARGGK